jgi:two-component system chemotaxis response regulator CheY
MSVDFSKPVLVVDAYKPVARIILSLLKQAGFTDVDILTEGCEALAKMKERPYGLVITDWHTSPVDGLELVKRAKADEALKDTPIILVSGEASPDRFETAREAGAASYLVKPFDAETLRNRIERALAA